MNIRNIYADRYLVPEEYRENFTRKRSLNPVELLGLEAVLIAFIQQYEEREFGADALKNLHDYTRYNSDSVDILDGCYDTYIFGNYAIDCVWMTEAGSPMLTCYRLESDEYEDPFDIVAYTDWSCECEEVYFCLG